MNLCVNFSTTDTSVLNDKKLKQKDAAATSDDEHQDKGELIFKTFYYDTCQVIYYTPYFG